MAPPPIDRVVGAARTEGAPYRELFTPAPAMRLVRGTCPWCNGQIQIDAGAASGVCWSCNSRVATSIVTERPAQRRVERRPSRSARRTLRMDTVPCPPSAREIPSSNAGRNDDRDLDTVLAQRREQMWRYFSSGLLYAFVAGVDHVHAIVRALYM